MWIFIRHTRLSEISNRSRSSCAHICRPARILATSSKKYESCANWKVIRDAASVGATPRRAPSSRIAQPFANTERDLFHGRCTGFAEVVTVDTARVEVRDLANRELREVGGHAQRSLGREQFHARDEVRLERIVRDDAAQRAGGRRRARLQVPHHVAKIGGPDRSTMNPTFSCSRSNPSNTRRTSWTESMRSPTSPISWRAIGWSESKPSKVGRSNTRFIDARPGVTAVAEVLERALAEIGRLGQSIAGPRSSPSRLSSVARGVDATRERKLSRGVAREPVRSEVDRRDVEPGRGRPRFGGRVGVVSPITAVHAPTRPPGTVGRPTGT